MHKETRVIIVEDDPYSRDMMAMLLARDWRTRVVAELGSIAEVDQFLKQTKLKSDVVILDTEMPGDDNWSDRIADAFRSSPQTPKILCTGTQVNLGILKRFASGNFEGYVLKNEILYALASAVAQISKGQIVTTPKIWRAAQESLMMNFHSKVAVLNGVIPVAQFTERENEIVRLGILFNLTHRDMADELVVSPIWVSELVSKVYEKLGLREIVADHLLIDEYFEDSIVSERIKSILNRSSSKSKSNKLRKTPWVSTLAFHMLTVPEKEYPLD